MRPAPVLVIAVLLGATGGDAVAEKRVDASAHPRRVAPAQAVVIRFRTRETLDGVYRARAHRRPGLAGCATAQSRTVTAPAKGRIVRLRLRPPNMDGERRWCAGAYRARVFFKQTVRCAPDIQCGDSVEVPLGRTTFTVVPEP